MDKGASAVDEPGLFLKSEVSQKQHCTAGINADPETCCYRKEFHPLMQMYLFRVSDLISELAYSSYV